MARYTCPGCGKASSDRVAAVNRYCGSCHRFDPDPARSARPEPPGDDARLDAAVAAIEAAERDPTPENLDAADAASRACVVVGVELLTAELAVSRAVSADLAAATREALLNLGRLRHAASIACDAFADLAAADPAWSDLERPGVSGLANALVELGRLVGKLEGWQVVRVSGRLVLIARTATEV
jgi:hypothetical protein